MMTRRGLLLSLLSLFVSRLKRQKCFSERDSLYCYKWGGSLYDHANGTITIDDCDLVWRPNRVQTLILKSQQLGSTSVPGYFLTLPDYRLAHWRGSKT